MKKYRVKGPDGTWWETTAPSMAKAKANFAYRLRRAGIFISDAYSWASDVEEVAS